MDLGLTMCTTYGMLYEPGGLFPGTRFRYTTVQVRERDGVLDRVGFCTLTSGGPILSVGAGSLTLAV